MDEQRAFAGPPAEISREPIEIRDEPMPLFAAAAADIQTTAALPPPPPPDQPNHVTVDVSVLAGMIAQMEEMKERILSQAAAAHTAEQNRLAETAQYEQQMAILAASAGAKQQICEDLQAQVLHAAQFADRLVSRLRRRSLRLCLASMSCVGIFKAKLQHCSRPSGQ